MYAYTTTPRKARKTKDLRHYKPHAIRYAIHAAARTYNTGLCCGFFNAVKALLKQHLNGI